jgi:hypothetical protein
VVRIVCSSKWYIIETMLFRLPSALVKYTVQRWPEPRFSLTTFTSSIVATASSADFISDAEAS